MGDFAQQLNLFNFNKERKVITKPIRLIELFSGIGAQAKALEILGVPFEHWKTCVGCQTRKTHNIVGNELERH